MPSVPTILTAIAVTVGAFMVFLIMLQEGKGGGLASLGGTKAAGIEGVTNPIRRATGYMAGLFFFLLIVLGIVGKPTTKGDFITDKEADKSADAAVEKAAPAVNVGPGPVGPARVAEPVKVEVPKATEPAKPETPKATEPAKPDAPKAAETPKAVEPAKTDAPKTEASKATDPVKTEAPKEPEKK